MFSKRVYLDTAAAHPVRKTAEQAFIRALACYGNPSAPHTEGREAKRILEDAREVIARLGAVRREAVIFTGNATEANALAIEGTVRARSASGTPFTDMHLLYMEGSHSSVVKTVEAMMRLGVKADSIPLTSGTAFEEAIRSRIRPETILISIEAIMSETGLRNDPRAVRQTLVGRVGTPPLIHVDASQLPLVESFEQTRLGADFITLDAQKVGGVRGIGALLAPARHALLPLIEGGGQEQGLRAGTEAPALAAAFAAALTEAAQERTTFVSRSKKMREQAIEYITREIPGALINEGKENAPHILNVSFPGRDTDYLVALLDEAGFAVSTRSSCETDSEEGSRTVFAQTGDGARALATLRISWNRGTTEGALKRFLQALRRAIAFLDRSPG